MNTIEIELRYEVLDKNQLPQFLAGFTKLQSNRDIDTYFDTADARLYQRGIFIRNRNDKKLDFKFNRACLADPNLPIQDYCEEHSFELPLKSKDLPNINELLMSLCLTPMQEACLENLKQCNRFGIHYVVDKIRTSFAYNFFTIGIDEVADLGIFLEIELMASSIDRLAQVKQEMQSVLKNISLKPLHTGYGTLLLRKKDFNHYLLGRFVLEEDKMYRTARS